MVITVESFSSARGCEQLSATITDPFFVSAANVRPYAGDLIRKILFFQFESNNNNDKNVQTSIWSFLMINIDINIWKKF